MKQSFKCLFRLLSLDNNDLDRELSAGPLLQDSLIQQQEQEQQQQIIDPGRYYLSGFYIYFNFPLVFFKNASFEHFL